MLIQCQSTTFSVEKVPFNDMYDFIKEHNKTIIDRLMNRPAEHPLYWSILDLIEGAFTGDEDFLSLLSTHSVFE